MSFHQIIEHPYYSIAYSKFLLNIVFFISSLFLLGLIKSQLSINRWQVFITYFLKINSRSVLLLIVILCELFASLAWNIPLESIAQDFLVFPVVRRLSILSFIINIFFLLLLGCSFYYHVTDCLIKVIQTKDKNQ